MQKEHDMLAKRVVLMLQRFNNGARLTVEEMAEEFGVSIRTVQRDLVRLSFLPIEKEQGMYYLASYALGKLSFKDIQEFSTVSGISELYPILDANSIVDILNPKTQQVLKVQGHNHEDLSFRKSDFDALGVAIINQEKMAFEYNNKSRQVESYRLFNTHGIWYLLAVDEGILKHFTFSKIKYLSKTKEYFEIDINVVDRIEENSLTWKTHEPIDIVLKVSTEVAEYFLRRDLLPYQELLEEHETHLVLKAKVAFEEEILRLVRYWVPHIHIVEPKHLQEKLENSLKVYIKNSC